MNAWTLRLFVDNAFNEDVDLYRVVELSESQYRSPFVSRGVNQPRTVGLQLTWDLE
jgi:outer membrane receptor protein involved in Fe transport